MGTNNPDAPSVVSALQDMIQATTAWQDAGGVAASHYYPRLPESSASTVFPREVTSHRANARPAFVGVSAPQYELRVTIQAFGRYAHTITAVSGSTVTVAGDQTSQVAAGSQLTIWASTDNNGIYEIDSAAYSAGDDETTYTLTDALPDDSTADGTVFVGAVDDLATALIGELLEQATGLWINDVDHDMAELPELGSEKTSLYESVTFTISAGLEAAA